MKVGITGGIGSGKTTVCKIFETLGIPVYYADDRAKQLMVDAPLLVASIKGIFGEAAYQADGALDRAFIAQAAFSDKEKLQRLNAAVHPAVLEDAVHWHNAQNGVPYTLKEAALLIESGGNRLMDRLVVVTAPLALRLARVAARDGVPEAAVKARMDAQMPEEEKIKLADFIIQNDGQHPLVEQVLAIHRRLLCDEL